MSIYVRDADGNRQKIAGVGLPGPAGKSAYQYAVEGGFSGTEEEFRAVVGGRSNPSLLDNGYFADPINQRGKMEYTGEGYTICRWKLAQNDTNFLKIENGFIHVHIGSFGAFGQFVTGLDINSKYTFSFLTNENELAYFTMQNLITTGSSFPIKIGNRTIQLYVYNTYVSNPKAENVTAFLLHVPAVDDAIDINFVAAKLELGPVQTLAHKEGDTWVLNDPPPNKALELAKCQRYQLIYREQELGLAHRFNNLFLLFMKLPVPLRTRPNVSVGGQVVMRTAGQYVPVTNVTLDTYNNGTMLLALSYDGTTDSDVADIIISGSDSYLAVDANL